MKFRIFIFDFLQIDIEIYPWFFFIFLFFLCVSIRVYFPCRCCYWAEPTCVCVCSRRINQRVLCFAFGVHIRWSCCTSRWWFRDIKRWLGKQWETVWACSGETLIDVPCISPVFPMLLVNTQKLILQQNTAKVINLEAPESTVLYSWQFYKFRLHLSNDKCMPLSWITILWGWTKKK